MNYESHSPYGSYCAYILSIYIMNHIVHIVHMNHKVHMEYMDHKVHLDCS